MQAKPRKARKAADELMQKEVVRKLRKWDAVCRKARTATSSSQSTDSTPTSASAHGEAESMELNKGMQLPLSNAVDEHPGSTTKKKPMPSKSESKDDDWYESNYYLMTPFERQEARGARSAGEWW